MATATHILEPRIVTVGGYRLHMLEGGQGPAVLLLHGFAGSSEDWRATAEFLVEQGYRALAVDCLGFGRSEKPGDAPYSLQLIAGLYAELLDTLEIEQAMVVAHSMGGKYALTLALLHPQRDRATGSCRQRRLRGALTPDPRRWGSATRPGHSLALGSTTVYPSHAQRHLLRTRTLSSMPPPSSAPATALLGPDNRRALTAH
jgi:pimeloyl-ACP methyl ester carboxylesterase